MSNPELSIVFGTRNRPDDFRRLVRSIEEHTRLSAELIIADASDTALIDESDFVLPGVVIRESPRLGYSKGMNNAFRYASGQWCLLLNDDCEVLPGYDVEAVGFMRANPQIGMGALYYSERGRPFSVNSYYQMVYANFPILSTELGNRIGWFDESIPLYGSDNALTFKVLLDGKGVDGIPGARIIHHATDDQHRRDNNDYETRVREAEALRDKYGPYLPDIQRVYRETGSGKHGAVHDQTPDWMWPKVQA